MFYLNFSMPRVVCNIIRVNSQNDMFTYKKRDLFLIFHYDYLQRCHKGSDFFVPIRKKILEYDVSTGYTIQLFLEFDGMRGFEKKKENWKPRHN